MSAYMRIESESEDIRRRAEAIETARVRMTALRASA
jgi:hypothetical protein